MRISKWEVAIALALAVLTGGLAALVPDDPPVRIDRVRHDAAAGVLVIEGAHFTDGVHARQPYVEIGGRPAEVVAYANDRLTVRAGGLTSGGHALHVVRRAGTRPGLSTDGGSPQAMVRLVDVLAGAVAEPAPQRVAAGEPAPQRTR